MGQDLPSAVGNAHDDLVGTRRAGLRVRRLGQVHSCHSEVLRRQTAFDACHLHARRDTGACGYDEAPSLTCCGRIEDVEREGSRLLELSGDLDLGESSRIDLGVIDLTVELLGLTGGRANEYLLGGSRRDRGCAA